MNADCMTFFVLCCVLPRASGQGTERFPSMKALAMTQFVESRPKPLTKPCWRKVPTTLWFSWDYGEAHRTELSSTILAHVNGMLGLASRGPSFGIHSCLCLCVCVYVSVCVCACICTCVCTWVCCLRAHAFTFKYMLEVLYFATDPSPVLVPWQVFPLLRRGPWQAPQFGSELGAGSGLWGATEIGVPFGC